MRNKETDNKKAFAPKKCFANAEVINLKLHLDGTKSVRVVSLPGNMTMYWFAKLIMDCFGFDGYHMYHFEDNRFNVVKPMSGPLAMFGGMDFETESARREIRILQKTIAQVFPKSKDSAKFLYDYGDGWEVEITRMADRKNVGMFECVKSEGINAYEDIGGSWRLEHARKICESILANPSGRKKLEEEDVELLDWLVGDKEKYFEENLRAFLTTPTCEDIAEILRDYNKSKVLKGMVPEFYDDDFDDDALAAMMLEDEEIEED